MFNINKVEANFEVLVADVDLDYTELRDSLGDNPIYPHPKSLYCVTDPKYVVFLCDDGFYAKARVVEVIMGSISANLKLEKLEPFPMREAALIAYPLNKLIALVEEYHAAIGLHFGKSDLNQYGSVFESVGIADDNEYKIKNPEKAAWLNRHGLDLNHLKFFADDYDGGY